jgi:putative chitinase
MRSINAAVLAKLVAPYRGSRGHRQHANISAVAIFLPAALLRHSICTPLRQAHFLAQVCEESWGFSDLVEEGDGQRYEGMKGLGNVQPGDGPRFKGRGLIQLTGRANYDRVGRELDLDLTDQPELAGQADVAVETACTFWSDRGLNHFADLDDLREVTRRVNGNALLGLKERGEYLAKAKTLLAGFDQLGDFLGSAEFGGATRPA